MAIRVALHHRTVYEYDRPVVLGPQVIRLRPAPHCRTPVVAYSLKIEPGGHFLNWHQDPQSNFLARAVFPEKTRRFAVDVDLIAEVSTINPFDFFLEPDAFEFPFEYEPWLDRELRPFREIEGSGPLLEGLVAAVDRSPRQTVDFLVDLNRRIHERVAYVIRMEPGVQSCEQTLELGNGSCRDSAWLLVQVLRRLGLAARFVSGYLIQLRPDVKPLDGPAGPDSDFTDLHAWAEVYLPGAGWVGLDATSGLLAGEGHLPVAATPDPQSASPISGSVEVSEVQFHHEMTIERIHEDPRVTKPYTDEQWAAIDELGRQVDGDLDSSDVRLTMGGEPTFVSIDDMQGDEWNTAALGPAKRQLAHDLLLRLKERFGPGGLLHFGQGKWYPGEPLPRWALGVYWRIDGHPMWRDDRWIAQDGQNRGHDAATAARFIHELAGRLNVDGDYVLEAFEDPLHYLRAEARLPINLTPEDNRLERAEDRERLRRVFEKGLNTPAGYVLPLQRQGRGAGKMWQSGLWMLRGQHLYLLPGDSPLGLRLPLPSLPWVDPRHAPYLVEVDPFAERQGLPVPERQLRRPNDGERTRAGESEVDRPPQPGESAPWVVRTALAVECREGRLSVFLPPLTAAEDYIELLARIEDTAEALETPIVVEGYTPPADPRLGFLKVTPDPGVIEVNIHPAGNWPELVENTTTLYDLARVSRLGTEKFMLDGRHTGTGGGNHFVLGAAQPSDSPFLRRPDLLRSLVAYWLNHPSLSYLFSGLFIGPTSQAPRVDETRADALYELEIAFEQIDRAGWTPPWMVDRIFRHLLVDVTGNTHRSEFCIDKLYAPESATGRLGLLELRSFEMPPHARMSLTQQLLMRALISWFWREPYRAKPVRWGTRLHDEFMLPHRVRRDFHGVLDDLRRTGYAFRDDWFDCHFEFRFPKIGRVEYGGIELELRNAGEPWYVLGEEPAAGATARYVDSSVERVEAKLRGSLAERYVLVCNGRRVPLRPTGVHGEMAAGVRFRAWQPPSCLHPTIGVHTPLVFDLVDTWSGRSMGGCTYHVAHPGGRDYQTFPVNAYEAEARRAARFFPFGHTPGPLPAPPPEECPETPWTLDLRRAAPLG